MVHGKNSLQKKTVHRRLIYKERTRTHAEWADPRVRGLARSGLLVACPPRNRVNPNPKSPAKIDSAQCALVKETNRWERGNGLGLGFSHFQDEREAERPPDRDWRRRAQPTSKYTFLSIYLSSIYRSIDLHYRRSTAVSSTALGLTPPMYIYLSIYIYTYLNSTQIYISPCIRPTLFTCM